VRYTHPDRHELDMTFSFHHLKVDYPDGEKWTDAAFDLLALKDVLTEWQVGMNAGGGWNALFWCNHDQPRVVSRFGDDGEHRVASATMLATLLHLMQGTPYIYQGEELGMADPGFPSISYYRDVESLNAYERLLALGMPEPRVLDVLAARSRDNARTPMQWTAGRHAGFTNAEEPWIEVAPDHTHVNAEQALSDPDAVFWHYRRLIDLRKTDPLVTTGRYELLDREHPAVFAYLRRGDGEALLVVANMYGEPTSWAWPQPLAVELPQRAVLVSNLGEPELDGATLLLRPYEAVVWRLASA
jgi:trehalose-6-phosphate hydrolase